jgi:hypothetical protein
MRRAEDVSMIGDRRRLCSPGYAEVRNLHMARVGDKDVVRLYVTVDDAMLVGCP